MVIHKVSKNGALCGRGYRAYGSILTEDDKLVTCSECLELMDLAVRDGSLDGWSTTVTDVHGNIEDGLIAEIEVM